MSKKVYLFGRFGVICLAAIRIYVACHKNLYVPEHPLLYPLQIGAALQNRLNGFLKDDKGENISSKNPSYCELTGQYWVWKNEQADYYGFYHYRRYFSFDDEKLPYRILNFPDAATLKRMGYEAERMEQWIRQYDILVPIAEEMYETAWQNYARAPHHYLVDLQLAATIVQEQHPDYAKAVEEYLNGTKLYLKNMYIMQHDLFHQYCNWLFPILAEFDQRNNWEKYHGNNVALRVDGYLAERLFGVWYTHLKMQNSEKQHFVKCCELSRIHFAAVDGENRPMQWMKYINQILPPSSRRRSIVSRCARFVLKRVRN